MERQQYLAITARLFGTNCRQNCTHLEVGSDSAPGGLQRKGQLERINWGEAGKVDCERAVVLLSKVSPTYLGIHLLGLYGTTLEYLGITGTT